jgi:hypothetical protein
MAVAHKKKPRIKPQGRTAIRQRIAEIHAELDAMPLVVASTAQFAREIELDEELTVLKLELSTSKTG